MVSRAALDEYTAANNGIVALAQKDLVKFWRLLDTSNPGEVKAAMLQFMPELVSTYGETAALLAADFYESVRPAGLPSYSAIMADTPPLEQIEAATRYNIDPAFKGDPDAALSNLANITQRLVNQPGRDTIVKNVDRDPDGAGWARVPVGSRTCVFCRMLASRGAVYSSKKAAGYGMNKYHSNCDCKAVPVWSESDYPAGYDPDALYEDYAKAHEPGMSTKATLAAMRKQDGEFVTAIADAKVATGKMLSDPRGRRQDPLGYVDGKPLSDDIYNETDTARADSDFRFIDASTDRGASNRATGALQYFMETEKAAKQAARNLINGRSALDGVDLSDASFLLTDGYEVGDLQADITAAATKLREWDADRVPLGRVYKGIQFDQGATIEDVRRGLMTEGLNFTSVTPDLDLAEKYAGRPWLTRSVVLEIDGAKGIKLNSVGDHAIKTESLFSGDIEILEITEVDDRFIVKATAK